MAMCRICGQETTCDCRYDEDGPPDLDGDGWDDLAEPLWFDGNGVLTERRSFGGLEVIVHYDDIPESDITTVGGIRCTTALRTAIDIAPDLDPAHLAQIVQDFLARGLFTVEEARRRLAQPDMATRAGAEILRRILPP